MKRKKRSVKFTGEMPNDDEEIVILCRRIAPGETHGDIESAMVRLCGECKEPVWFAPSSAKIEKERGAKIRCMECAGVDFESEEEFDFIQPTPEQWQEIGEQLLKNARRRHLN
jgi:hypothetical protein